MTGCRRLAAAIILQAVREAMDADADGCLPARKWLAADAQLWMRLLGMNPRGLRHWLQIGCPGERNAPRLDCDDAYLELMNWCKIITMKSKQARFGSK
ncbi:MAG: hypothetical protein ROW39_01505 [Anaerolineaceae bacterium]|jgi:hypothetical protein